MGGGGIRFSQQWSGGWLVSKQWAARSYLAKLWMRKFHSCVYTACLMWLTFIAVVGWGLQLQRVAVERGAGACRGHGQEPVSVSRLRAPLSSANLPIYFSSGMDYRWARPEATTARFGHGSAAAGQGTKGRDKRWLRGPRLLQPGKRPGWRGGGLLSCAAVSSTNLLVSEAGRKFYFGSQASLPESKRSALAVSLFLFDPPTHPGNRCSGEQGGGCSCSE